MTAAVESFDVVIIGAGAAGLMCALEAGRRGRRVVLIDHADQPGAKILISGGGRCNFTNLEADRAERYLSSNPHFCKSALSRYAPREFIAMVERHRIAYHEKTLGQLFCDSSARAIVEMLLDECRAAHVEVSTGHRVTDIARTDRFRIETNRTMLTASALVVATGGLSIPKMGATGFAYDVARRFGLAIVEPRPGLVGLQMGDDLRGLCNALTGVSVDAIATCGRTSFRESLLFTHRGFSGPAILQISSYWKNGGPILLDLAPAINAENFLRDRKRIRPKAELKTVLAEVLPHRLAEAIAKETNATHPEMANLPDRLLGAIARRLQRWEVRPVDSEGWSKAEVTVGGIDTAGLSSRTMEAHAVAGLYFIGEAVDVTGWLGGYNFQWGWSSGWCAGQAI
jgi:predicted Rossmann fold flavoprotein